MAEQLQETIEIEEQPQQSVASGSAASNQPSPQQHMGCTGDCKNCVPIQRGYCASQIAYNMQNAVARIENVVGLLAQAITELNARFANIETLLESQQRTEEQPDLLTPEAPEKPTKKKK